MNERAFGVEKASLVLTSMLTFSGIEFQTLPLARAIMPGTQHLTFIVNALLGIVGSIERGLIARLFFRPEPGSKFHPAGFILSIIGAIILLFLFGENWRRDIGYAP